MRTYKLATVSLRLTPVPLLLVALVAGVVPAAAASRGPTGSSNSPSFTTAGSLSGVAATSPGNAWAVGSSDSNKTLVLHWNGTVWKLVPSPSPGAEAELSGVAARSADDAWAVGCTACDGSSAKSLILHWNGADWKQVPTPDSLGSSLSSVATTSADNAWAVGSRGSFSRSKSLILHWNGTVWKQVSSPNPGKETSLASVAATYAGNAWAVGSIGYLKTLILHWNGTVWKQVSSPNPEPGENIEHFLTGVAVTSARNAWAVGGTSNCGCGPATGVILHWNGSTWKQAPSSGSGLRAVAASASRAWVVGGAGEGDGPTTTLALGWNGKEWKHVPSPSPGTDTEGGGSRLLSLAIASADSTWAVGGYLTGSGSSSKERTLILHWNGTVWRASDS